MRWHILHTLLYKEALRHLANRGGLVLIALLVVASMLLSFFGTQDGAVGGLAPGVQRCYVDYWEDSPLIAHLRGHVPDEWKDRICFRPVNHLGTDAQGRIVYPQGTGAIQVRPGPNGGSLVEMRSKSRDGVGDLGVNYNRIVMFLSKLQSAG